MLRRVPRLDAVSRLHRRGLGILPGHLEQTYDVAVRATKELDTGVLRITLADSRRWVARLFPACRPLEQTLGDAAVLRFLAEREYPAERVAASEPVSLLEGQALLVTEFVAGVSREQRRTAIRAAGGLAALGSLLGRLHTLPVEDAPVSRPGGAWHHLADGSPADEVAALRRLVSDHTQKLGTSSRAPLEQLYRLIDRLDDGAGLPECFVHPDFVPANVVPRADGSLVLVDWTGAGRGPRMWSLAFLLWSVGMNGDRTRVDRTVAGYRRHVMPTGEELDRLEALICVRPTVFAAWAASTGRARPNEAVQMSQLAHQTAAKIAWHARAAFAAST